MSVTLNGNTYSTSDFVGTDGRGFNDTFAATGLTLFPESIFTDMLAELASAQTILSLAPGAAGGIAVSDGAAWVRAAGATITDAGAAVFTDMDSPIGQNTPAAIAGTTGAFSGNVTVGAGGTAFLTVFNTVGTGGTTINALGGPVEGNFKSADSLNTAATRWTFGRDNQSTGDFVFLENGVAQGRFLSATVGMVLPGTLTSTGDFAVGASKFNVTASTGALQMDGDLAVSGTGPHAIGGAVGDYIQWRQSGSFTSGGASNRASMFEIASDLTSVSGDTTVLAYMRMGSDLGGSIVTQSNSETIADVATMVLSEPGITKGTDTITNASTLLITGAPTEGANNYAILVDSGAVKFGGTFEVTSTSTLTGNVGIGAASSANADLLLEAGRLMLKESATPTADTNYGKIYTKTDNKLYFQDGAGTEHEVAFV